MKSYNNHVPQGGYKTWKGSGEYSNQVGITAGNIRPQTNKDARNIALYRPGSSRPIKHYRRGTSTPTYILNAPQQVQNQQTFENIEANYYTNNQVKSSVSDKIIGQLIDRPGEFAIKPMNNSNTNSNTNSNSNSNPNQKICNGVAIISNWAPIKNLTEKPQPITQTANLCCNAQRKAKRRAIYANTNLKKNYYTTTGAKLYNRCKTFEQQSFNYPTLNQELSNQLIQDNQSIKEEDIKNMKPGGPLSFLNTYKGNCNPNILITQSMIYNIVNQIAYILIVEGLITFEEYDLFNSLNIIKIQDLIAFLNEQIQESEKPMALEFAYLVLNGDNKTNRNGLLNGPCNLNGCQEVIYKPKNYTFAQEASVTSSTRLLNLNVQTINKNIANIRELKGDGPIKNTQYTPLIYKNKAPKCNPAYFTKDGNPKTCFGSLNDVTI
jgi:hypothetical protein